MGLLSKIFRRNKGGNRSKASGVTKKKVSSSEKPEAEAVEFLNIPSSSSTIDESLPSATKDEAPSHNKDNDGDDNSIFAAPSPSGVMEWNINFADAYCDRSVYGGSVSSEGMTLGNQSFATSAFLSVADGGRSRCMSDDASFFEQSCTSLNMDVIHVFAPSGKLGMALDTPDNSGCPVVHYVKEVSPIHGKIMAGDKLVAIDDEDVSYLTAIKISKILNRKSSQVTRKLTVLRAIA
mmetsp:Transcript_20112/g.57719  ORF Transcript_20112/g.57719 Transcript_20112/m.57719 type:complete len:236 (+) Transcript_20112:242-949(+)